MDRRRPTTYWNGCSTGGRQGFEMAQFHPEMFDGILAGSPAFNWNRFQIAEVWAQVVVANVDPADCPTRTERRLELLHRLKLDLRTNAYTAANNAGGCCLRRQ